MGEVVVHVFNVTKKRKAFCVDTKKRVAFFCKIVQVGAYIMEVPERKMGGFNGLEDER